MVEWLLRGKPRQAQIEAIRRSYYGWARHDRNPNIFDVDPDPVSRFLHAGPARGWGHFLQMRVGKTPTLLNEYELFRRDHGIKWLLMICPSKFRQDWPLEAEHFGSTVPALAFESDKKPEAWRFLKKNPDGGIFVIHYEALKYPASYELLDHIARNDTMICADESIELKNPNSDRTPVALELAKRCGVRRVLSGKPITQGPHDIWAQLRFIAELDGFNYYVFKTVMCKTGGFKGKKILGVKDGMVDELNEIIGRRAWVARRSDWMITPGVDYAERRIALHPSQAIHYNQMERDFLTVVAEDQAITAEQIITRMIKQQQISSGFIYDENRKVHWLVTPGENPKIKEIVSMMEEEIEGKVIIYCVHIPLITALQEALKKYNPAVIYRDADVIAEKNRFNTDPACRVLIGQMTAVRYGHTLMGTVEDPCYTEIFAENNYSLNDRSQCEERAQGEGQQYPISIFDFMCTPADLAPIRALQRKEDIASAVLGYARGMGILPRPELRES